MNQITAWLDKVRDEVRVKPKNAHFKNDYWNNPIIRGKYGQDMNTEEMKKWLKNWHAYINKPYNIPMVEVKPEVTSKDLRNVHLKLIGSYTTLFNPGNVNRTTNIRLAAKKIHNLVMLPGDKFSFNKVVGERTAARGYKTAHVIVEGEYTEGIGGGICQLSSTLYNSTDRAGLKMLRVVHHSANVDYVPKGRDATVSWGGPDFRFQNNLDAPILIRVFVNGGKLTVNVYTVPGAKVKKRNVKPAPESFKEVPVDEEGKNELSSKQTSSHP
ncbi:VanW family protein [Thermoactinomyces sp. AMNI-1]|uniref:VanW family protein n=2 Tax=Thermoactinomyces mirandus TaxID=2756294 RepID=A0A7W1XPU2_9BACL|nr:VanW family protein [Thermoactinomyces mirandus]